MSVLNFEEWAKLRDYDTTRSRLNPERYANERTQGAWAAWCHRDENDGKPRCVAKSVPAGFALVPVEPPREMMEAGEALPGICESDLRLRRLGWSLMACQNRRRYLAMLAAAPKP